MSDLEGFSRKLLSQEMSIKDVKSRLIDQIMIYKDELSYEASGRLADAILVEVKNSKIPPKSNFVNFVLDYPKSGVTMGVMGVGSRGEGDFFVHRRLAEIAGLPDGSKVLLYPLYHDDAGAIEIKGNVLVTAVDGMHSRLSDFPFLAGFHVTRATLRDVYVKGARPVGMLIDLHLADDGDVSKLFDFEAGVSTVSMLTETPILTGSTLRIGGDMVIGNRITGCVGAFGVAENESMLAARHKVKPDSVILMTEGAGGGTICTAAIYSGRPDVILETLNIQFVKSCKTLLESGLVGKLYAMTDVTNGGIRGDASEISKISKIALYFDEKEIRGLVNYKVLKLLEDKAIDYLGVSLDALMIFTPEDYAKEIMQQVRKVGVKIRKVGWVEKDVPKVALITPRGEEDLTLKFRESAYTKIKKVVGEKAPYELNELKSKVEDVAEKAIKKRDRVIKYLTG
ncbi:MAG: AIR synthase-related protein [Candidatus Methylarchaceae archaeon HK02M2]|nr:AIR synthase-related protein [Candidatus Methylarchaceae archaeon HK02M2]